MVYMQILTSLRPSDSTYDTDIASDAADAAAAESAAYQIARAAGVPDATIPTHFATILVGTVTVGHDGGTVTVSGPDDAVDAVLATAYRYDLIRAF